MIRRQSKTCSSRCSSRRTRKHQSRSSSISMPTTIRSTEPGRPVLSRLLRQLLLLAALHLLRPAPAGGQAAALEHRWGSRSVRRNRADYYANLQPLSAHAHFAAPRQRLLPRRANALVRGEQGRLSVRPCQKPATGCRNRNRTGRSDGRERSNREGGADPRFVVTTLRQGESEARHLYEKVYCARGEMENRIKEC